MNQTFARRSTWIVIALVLLIGGGAYFYFQTRAATTVGSDAPSFQADLKNTLALQAGVGAPTFTRATAATVTDFEGLIKTVKSGEARFEGARRVENKITTPNIADASWTKQKGGTGVDPIVTYGQTDPFGGATASRLQLNRGNGNTASDFSDVYFNYDYSSSSTAKNGVIRIAVKSNTGSNQIFGLIGDTLNSSVVWRIATTAWQTFSLGVTSTSAFNNLEIASWGSYPTSTNSLDLLVAFPQAEITTGQSNQNPSEYVSTGVLSAPYHGAGVDGVQYFTTQNGNTVASNVVTEAVGTPIPDATLHGYVAEG